MTVGSTLTAAFAKTELWAAGRSGMIVGISNCAYKTVHIKLCISNCAYQTVHIKLYLSRSKCSGRGAAFQSESSGAKDSVGIGQRGRRAY